MAHRPWIGELLLDAQVVSPQQLERALARQRQAPDRGTGQRLCSLLLDNGVSERKLIEVLTQQLGVPGLVLGKSTFDLSALRLIPRAIAERHRLLPASIDADTLVLACADPGQSRLIEQVAFATGRQVHGLLALEGPLSQMTRFAYAAYDAAAMQGGTATQTTASLEIVRPSLEPAPAASVPAPVSGVPAPMPTVAAAADVVDLASFELSAPGFEAPMPATITHAPSVLIVDDDDSIRSLLVKVLSMDGYEVTEARTGREALRRLNEQTPRLVILDAMLPEVHGFTICRQLKQASATAHVPVVMVSAIYRGWEHAREIQERHGADRFVEKPFDVHYLRRVVGELLGDPPPPPALSPAVLGHITQLRQEAEAAYAQGDIARGLALADAWLAIASFDPVPHLLRGNLLHQQGDYAGALTSFERAATFGPDLFAAHKNLALAYERLGFVRRAFERWRLARQHAPDDDARVHIDQRLRARYASFLS